MIQSIKVVNDHEERVITLIKEYIGILTRNKPQFQLLMKIVEQHRKAYHYSRKIDITN